MTVEASCHCGAVKIEMPKLPEKLLECNCSTCGRFAAKWAYFAPDEVNVIMKEGATATYIWGDRTTEFHHCTNCGCMTHYTSTELVEKKKVAVNGRMLTDRVLLDSVPSRHFDGRDTWKFID